MNPFHKTLALCLTLAAGLAAQGGQFNRTIDFGTAAWGGDLNLAGSAAYRDFYVNPLTRVQSASLSLYAASTLRMDGRGRVPFLILASDDSSISSVVDPVTRWVSRSTQVSHGMSVRVNGTTVFSYFSNTNAARTLNLSPLNLFGSSGYSEIVQVGPYSVSLRTNATSDVNATLTPRISTTTLTSGMRLAVNVQEEGSASASFSVAGVTVGVDSLLDLADPNLTLDLSTDFRSATALASWIVGTISTHLDVFAQSFGFRSRVPVVHLDVPGFSGMLSTFL
ncbi:MAG: hypothetical protein U1F36_20910 [Planctomycetota bacterium]